jgi:hypothetical protein
MAESYDKVIEGPGGLPLVGLFGLNTNKAASFRSTLGVSGAVTLDSTLSVGDTASFVAINSTSKVTALSGSAVTATGAQAFGISSTTTQGVYFGSGSPTISAATGSWYMRTDGSAATNRAYINTGGTAWTAISTVA